MQFLQLRFVEMTPVTHNTHLPNDVIHFMS